MSFSPAGAPADVGTGEAGTVVFPDLTVRNDESYVVAWSHFNPAADAAAALFQTFDAGGRPVGNPVRTDDGSRVSTAPAVAASNSGDFVVAWVGESTDVSDMASVHARQFDAAGRPKGPQFRVDPVAGNTNFAAAAAMDANGDFVVAYAQAAAGVPGQYDLFAQRYDRAGNAAGGRIQFARTPVALTHSFKSTLAMADSGALTATWVQAAPGGVMGVYARSFDPSGSARGPAFLVSTVGDREARHAPAVAMADDGRFAIAWRDAGATASGPHRIYARSYDASSTPLGEPVLVKGPQEGVAGTLFSLDLSMDNDGAFAVAYDDTAGGVRVSEVRHFNASGVQLGAATRLASGPGTDRGEPGARGRRAGGGRRQRGRRLGVGRAVQRVSRPATDRVGAGPDARP